MVTFADLSQSHQRLHATVRGLDDHQVREPSLLPGWTVAHVITHLARNADSVVRRLTAAAAGEVVDQYPGDPRRREAEIEKGADRSAAELVRDLERADDAIDELLPRLPEATWERQVRRGGASGTVMPARRLLRSRWREVEVHHVDLGLEYSPHSWPAELVAELLPDLLAGLPERTHTAALAAWALDRGPAPDLGAWDRR
jgi:maleylpyruvate isomerase